MKGEKQMTRKRISALGMAIIMLIMTISTVILDTLPVKADRNRIYGFNYRIE